MDELAMLADVRGTNDVCTFLHENRKDVCALLDALAQPVLLDPPAAMQTADALTQIGKETGVYIEQRLSLRAQRNVWSALAQRSLSTDSVHDPAHVEALRLARTFLQCAERKRTCVSDAVSCSLAQLIVAAASNAAVDAADSANAHSRDDVDDDASLASIQRDAAFRDAMKQLTCVRLAMPPREELAALSTWLRDAAIATDVDAPATAAASAAVDGSDAPQRPVLLRFTRVQPSASLSTAASSGNLLMAAGSESRKRRVIDLVDKSPASRSRKRSNEPSSSSQLQQQQQLHHTSNDDVDSNRTSEALALTTAEAPAQLSPETHASATRLAKQLADADAQASRAALDALTHAVVALIQDTINATTATQLATETHLAQLCRTLQLATTSDEALFQIATALVESSWSSRHAGVFLETSVLPKIAAAASVISRVLLQTALAFSARYTTALLDALLLPLLTTRTIGAAQGEAITRILRNGVPRAQLDRFLRDAFDRASRQRDANASATSAATPQPHMFANDAVLMVLQNILTMQAPLADATIDRFVACCETAQDDAQSAATLHKSLKFATLVFTIVSKYPEQCAAHAEAFEAIAKRLTSLMAKSTMRAVLKLQSSANAAMR